MLTASQKRLLGRLRSRTQLRGFYAASLNVRRGELVARLVAAVVRRAVAVVRSADGPALAPSPGPVAAAEVLSTQLDHGRRRGLPRPAAASTARAKVALFLNRCDSAKARLARSS